MARYYARSAVRFLVADKVVAPTAIVDGFYVIETKDKDAIAAIEGSPEFGRLVFDADEYDKEHKGNKSKAAQIVKDLSADEDLKALVLAGLANPVEAPEPTADKPKVAPKAHK